MNIQMKLNLKANLTAFLIVLGSISAFAQDTDSDGIVNSIDIDDDNDGVPDAIEDNCTPLFPSTNLGTKAQIAVPPGWDIVQSSPDIANVTSHVYGVWNSGCTSTAPAASNGHTQWVLISSSNFIFKANYI